MDSIKIVKNGFFYTNGGTHFIKFENITMIDFHSHDYNTGRWEVDVSHIYLNKANICTFNRNEKEAIALHKIC